jgi:hypothetical protein
MVNDRKKVLVITYSFPPSPRVAALRMQGLAKYLPRFGWDPTYLTVELPGEPQEGFRVIQTPDPYDVMEQLKRWLRLNPKEGLQRQLGIADQVSNTKKPLVGKITKRIEGWISYPDKKKTWGPIALKALRDLFTQERFDVLLSTSPPVITNLIARKIHEEFYLPWVADFRDLWTGNHYYPYGPIRKLADKRLEIKSLKGASALVTVSKPLSESLQALHEGKAVFAIPNGFDPDMMEENELHTKFSITYTGQLYQGKRDPELLFKVVRDLIQENLIKNDLQINFYGDRVFWLENLITEYGLDGIAIQRGIVDRSEAVKEQRSSQLLLSLNWDHPAEKGVYTGKIFEYLAARRPILALGGPPGVVSDLLQETKAGVHVRTEGELREAILSWYEEYQGKGFASYQGNQKIHNYSHPKMAERFADVLNEVSQ